MSAAASPATYRQQLVDLYAQYDPDKISKVDELLQRFTGHEEALISTVERKLKQSARRRSQSASPPEEAASSDQRAEPLRPRSVPEPLDAQLASSQLLSTVLPSASPASSGDAQHSYRARLTRLYEAHAPLRVSRVDHELAKYKGREEEVIQAAVQRFGPEPTVPPSLLTTPVVAPSEASDLLLTSATTLASSTTLPAAAQDHRSRAVELYLRYDPHKVHKVDAQLAKFKGKEDAYLRALEKKLRELASAGGSAEGTPTHRAAATEAVKAAGGGGTYADRLLRIYERYAPERAHRALHQLERYPGREEEVIQAAVQKYGPEPPVAVPPARTAAEKAVAEETGVRDSETVTASEPRRPSKSAALDNGWWAEADAAPSQARAQEEAAAQAKAQEEAAAQAKAQEEAAAQAKAQEEAAAQAKAQEEAAAQAKAQEEAAAQAKAQEEAAAQAKAQEEAAAQAKAQEEAAAQAKAQEEAAAQAKAQEEAAAQAKAQEEAAAQAKAQEEAAAQAKAQEEAAAQAKAQEEAAAQAKAQEEAAAQAKAQEEAAAQAKAQEEAAAQAKAQEEAAAQAKAQEEAAAQAKAQEEAAAQAKAQEEAAAQAKAQEEAAAQAKAQEEAAAQAKAAKSQNAVQSEPVSAALTLFPSSSALRPPSPAAEGNHPPQRRAQKAESPLLSAEAAVQRCVARTPLFALTLYDFFRVLGTAPVLVEGKEAVTARVAAALLSAIHPALSTATIEADDSTRPHSPDGLVSADQLRCCLVAFCVAEVQASAAPSEERAASVVWRVVKLMADFVRRCRAATLTLQRQTPPLSAGFWVHRCVQPRVVAEWRRCWARTSSAADALLICAAGSARVELRILFSQVVRCYRESRQAEAPLRYARNGLVFEMTDGSPPLRIIVCPESADVCERLLESLRSAPTPHEHSASALQPEASAMQPSTADSSLSAEGNGSRQSAGSAGSAVRVWVLSQRSGVYERCRWWVSDDALHMTARSGGAGDQTCAVRDVEAIVPEAELPVPPTRKRSFKFMLCLRGGTTVFAFTEHALERAHLLGRLYQCKVLQQLGGGVSQSSEV